MTTTTTTIAERVAAGAAWLDEHQPGWVDRINLDLLCLEHCHACVLGQLFGNFWEAPIADRPYSKVELFDYADTAAPLGFTGTRDGDRYGADGEYAALTAAWRTLVETRRAGAS